MQDWGGALLAALEGHAIAFSGDVAPAAEPAPATGPAITLTLRSPGAMIYYLGELSRPTASVESGARASAEHVPDADQRPAATPLLQCDGHADASKDRDHATQLRPMRLHVSPAGVSSPTHCPGAPSALPLSAQSTYVAVAHRGCRYAVALGLDGDRSSQAMALVGEVLQLQYKGVAAPSTVRVTLP